MAATPAIARLPDTAEAAPVNGAGVGLAMVPLEGTVAEPVPTGTGTTTAVVAGTETGEEAGMVARVARVVGQALMVTVTVFSGETGAIVSGDDGAE